MRATCCSAILVRTESPGAPAGEGAYQRGHRGHDSRGESVPPHGDGNADEALDKKFAALKAAGVKLYYVGCEVKDHLAYAGTQAIIGMLKKHGFAYHYNETPGGHTWTNWRIYLADLVPRLFR